MARKGWNGWKWLAVCWKWPEMGRLHNSLGDWGIREYGDWGIGGFPIGSGITRSTGLVSTEIWRTG